MKDVSAMTAHRAKTSAASTAGSFAPKKGSAPELLLDAPLVSDLAEEIAAELSGRVEHTEDDTFAQVFTRGDQRVLFWDEANFMGSIDGYTFERQARIGGVWQRTGGTEYTDDADEDDPVAVETLSAEQVRALVQELAA